LLGGVHKRRLQSGGREIVRCGHFAEKGGGSSDVDVCTFWYKNFGFFEIYGVSAWTREGRKRRGLS